MAEKLEAKADAKEVKRREVLGVDLVAGVVTLWLKSLGRQRLDAARETLEEIGKIIGDGKGGRDAEAIAEEIKDLISALEAK